MESRGRRISGSLNSLEVFATAVRLSNLSRAAKALNISQPAVSHHISTLERRLQQALFARRNNQITPTANARKLADAITLGLDHIDQVWRDLSIARADEVTIACSFGFADQWLTQRYSDLRNFMGKVQVHVLTTDRLREIDQSTVDATIVWNLEDAPRQPSFPLIREEVFPICSPTFLSLHPEIENNLGELPSESYLHFDVGASGFLTWSSWFTRCGIRVPDLTQGMTFDAYPFLLQAVRRSEGVGLGWKGVVDRALADGEVVRLSPSVVSREISYHVFHHPEIATKQSRARLLDWFHSQTLLD
ncbi:hypothetical protein AU467_31215 [Mesorhizobium loti]|uniref:HTH lysR-type domain-containing protein n=1 Tax=Rhizobium loti TaxID=381 RepID=A0A101KP12_RHILI|nr:hypothetical protein AU467_31215 [Mesorhizobium loti]